LIDTPLELIDLDVQLLVLLLEIMQLGVQGQQMRLHRRWGLVPFSLGKWKTPGSVFRWGGSGHDPDPWPLMWIQVRQNL
jgi:hypothetical protein